MILSGNETAGLLGEPIAALALSRWEADGGYVPVPFQVDERVWNAAAQEFRLALTGDPASNAADGSLSPQDEIVFMAGDAGRKAPPGAVAPGLRYAVELFDPIQRRRAWVYIARDGRPPPPDSDGVKPPYVRYNQREDIVETDRMRILFDRQNPALPREAFLKSGPAGAFTRILTGAAVELFLDIKYFFNISLDRENFHSTLVAYKAGPIRAIRRVASEIRWGVLRFRSDADSDFVFYRGRIEIPTIFSVPVNPGTFLAPASEAANYIFLDPRATQSAKIVNSTGMPGMRIDGVQSPAETAGNEQAVRWWSFFGEGWGVLSVLDWDVDGQDGGHRSYFYFADRPDSGAQDPALGNRYRMVEFARGRHRFTVRQFVGPDVSEDSLPKLIENLDSPLQITVHPVRYLDAEDRADAD